MAVATWQQNLCREPIKWWSRALAAASSSRRGSPRATAGDGASDPLWQNISASGDFGAESQYASTTHGRARDPRGLATSTKADVRPLRLSGISVPRAR
jgi:hypothetical protein